MNGKFHATLSLLLGAGLMASIVGAGSALFTDSADVGGNAFTAGTVILSTNPATTLVTFENMAAGDVVRAPITVSNDGSLDLRYAVTSAADNLDTLGLAAQLSLTVKTGVTLCTDATGFAADGTVVYGPEDLGSVAGTAIIGDPTAGDDTGDRTLAAAATEVLCFQVQLPQDSNDTYQGATTTATLTFAAEQTTNNP
ncbi:MAG: TasA family protein [Chloroflexota bacterium]